LAPKPSKKRLKHPDRDYPDELYAPIVLPPTNRLLLFTMSTEALEKYEEASGKLVWHERALKLLSLMQHYGVKRSDEHRWQNLALKLAYDLLPGFGVVASPPRGRGRPEWRSKRDNFQLADDIESLAFQEDITPGEACRRLTNRRGSRWKGEKSKNLLESYRRHCQKFNMTPEDRAKRYSHRVPLEIPPDSVLRSGTNNTDK
jgi:hypothetical protein